MISAQGLSTELGTCAHSAGVCRVRVVAGPATGEVCDAFCRKTHPCLMASSLLGDTVSSFVYSPWRTSYKGLSGGPQKICLCPNPWKL